MRRKTVFRLILAAALGGLGFAGPAPAAAVAWDSAAFAEQKGSFVFAFDAIPSATDQDTLVGLSTRPAAAAAALAAVVRFNGLGAIDALNGASYAAAARVPYTARAVYHFRLAVNVAAHSYSVSVTPPKASHPIALATNFKFNATQPAVASLADLDVGASLGEVGLRNLTINGVKAGFGSLCAYAGAGYADGCVGATLGAPQYPALLAAYKGKRPPFDVAGVDYAVGAPAGPLLDPSTAALPAGCGYASLVVRCGQNGATIRGYDFSLHGGIQLLVDGASNITVTGDKFALAPNCKDPALNIVQGGGAIAITHNTFYGGGPTCVNQLVFGTMISGTYVEGAAQTLQYNLFYRTPQDVSDNAGPTAASAWASINEKYNVFYVQGFGGHPDGIQLNGGNFKPIDVAFNTYYNTPKLNTQAGTQPFHIEAQLTSAIVNATVAYNTIATPGACNSGHNWPVGCAVNYGIACKSDVFAGWVDSNQGFAAYGNYIDWTGAIAALSNGSACAKTTWGNPAPNKDLVTGGSLSP